MRILSTKDYRGFIVAHGDNRGLDLRKHKKLLQSMERYGFLPEFPVVARREGGKLRVKDGQHRIAIAEKLGLPVYYVEESVDFDVALINNTPKVWTLRDYAQKYSANGISDYTDGLQFAERYELPVGTAFALLSGTTTFHNVQDAFMSGTWRIKDWDWANAVAGIYAPLAAMSKDVRNVRFINACMAVCRVKALNTSRLIANAKRCRDKLVAYSTKEAYLEMLEEIYNFGRKELLGLKAEATMAMKRRNVAHNPKAGREKAAA